MLNFSHSKLNFLLAILIMLNISCDLPQENKNKKAKLPTGEEIKEKNLSVATFAGGCFWCIEAVFERIEGVEYAISGYSGGDSSNPTYEEVSSGNSGHAEAVQVYFHKGTVSYKELLEVFFSAHDPTQLNRQGPDVGKQYRSAVFYHDDQQKHEVEEFVNEVKSNGKFDTEIVTLVEKFEKFYPAEQYHQDYYENNPQNPYIQSVSRKKVEKVEELFESKLKEKYQKD